MEGLGSFLLFAVFFYLMMRFGCGAHMMHGHGSHSGHGHSHKKGKGTKQVDPVCNIEVEDEQGYGKMYNATLYRFCSKDCLDKFDADPESYLNKNLVQHHDM